MKKLIKIKLLNIEKMNKNNNNNENNVKVDY